MLRCHYGPGRAQHATRHTRHAGEFEDRLKAVIKDVTTSSGRVILFIDEIHTVVGAGATSGAMDASNLLKPMLGRGGAQLCLMRVIPCAPLFHG